tara:strand:+ start:607 stop:1173 length:567 start_codon:yes stop_codon:yes gene_type:complete
MAYKNKEKKAANNKAWREANKEKTAAYYEANKEKKAAYHKAWHKANKEKRAAYNKDWAAANKEKRKEKRAANNKAWREANPDKSNAYSARRRALKLKLIPKHLKKCPIEKKRVDDIYKLSNLISKVTGIDHHVDHMWPLSDDGPHWSGNMQIITARENLTKRASVDLEVKQNIQQALNETVADKFQVA